MRYAKMRKYDISNGPGIRATLFTQGCPFQCEGCFNPETWAFMGGKEFDTSAENAFIEMAKDPNITGVSILGGEPFLYPYELAMLILRLRLAIGYEKEIWIWTGFLYETLENLAPEMLPLVDVIVDGKFRQDLFDPKLLYRGSSNQRVVDVQKSIKENEVKLLIN